MTTDIALALKITDSLTHLTPHTEDMMESIKAVPLGAASSGS